MSREAAAAVVAFVHPDQGPPTDDIAPALNPPLTEYGRRSLRKAGWLTRDEVEHRVAQAREATALSLLEDLARVVGLHASVVGLHARAHTSAGGGSWDGGYRAACEAIGKVIQTRIVLVKE